MTAQIRRRALLPEEGDWGEGLHPVLRRAYAARGIREAGQIATDLSRLLPVGTLGGVTAAVDLLLKHRERGRILVIGDFDADGATSTALMLRALRAWGFVHVDFLVPNRFEFGYGLTPEIVNVAAARSPSLLVTVDNGISSIAGVAAARALGLGRAGHRSSPAGGAAAAGQRHREPERRRRRIRQPLPGGSRRRLLRAGRVETRAGRTATEPKGRARSRRFPGSGGARNRGGSGSAGREQPRARGAGPAAHPRRQMRLRVSPHCSKSRSGAARI